MPGAAVNQSIHVAVDGPAERCPFDHSDTPPDVKDNRRIGGEAAECPSHYCSEAGNPKLKTIADSVTDKLRRVIAAI